MVGEDVIYVWVTLSCLAIAGAIFAAVLAAFQRWVTFLLFLVVYVVGVVALAVQAVLNS